MPRIDSTSPAPRPKARAGRVAAGTTREAAAARSSGSTCRICPSASSRRRLRPRPAVRQAPQHEDRLDLATKYGLGRLHGVCDDLLCGRGVHLGAGPRGRAACAAVTREGRAIELLCSAQRSARDSPYFAGNFPYSASLSDIHPPDSCAKRFALTSAFAEAPISRPIELVLWMTRGSSDERNARDVGRHDRRCRWRER
jgi:hypothetical protein